MSMTPFVRKIALTAHVTCSIGWLGAVVAFLILSIAGLMSRDAQIVRSAYIAMDLIGRYGIVPLSFAAFITGIVQSLGTPWGLLRHYWIVVKLILTLGATLLLLLHQFTAVAGAAQRAVATAAGELPDVGRWGTQLVGDATAALLVLFAISVIAIFKPWGLTPHGRREQQGSAGTTATDDARAKLPLSLKILLIVVALALIMFAAVHHDSGFHHGH